MKLRLPVLLRQSVLSCLAAACSTVFSCDFSSASEEAGIQIVDASSESLKEALTITKRLTGTVDYQYYDGVTFTGIYSYIYSGISGGAINCGSNKSIILSHNGSVEFSRNTAEAPGGNAYGGAIYVDSSSTLTMNDNGSVIFSMNKASSMGSLREVNGGAIYAIGTISISHNTNVKFFENAGAITSYKDVTLCHNGSVAFSKNKYALRVIGTSASPEVTLCHNDSVSVEDDMIFIQSGTLTLNHNGCVEFSMSQGADRGASIYVSGAGVYLNDNKRVSFGGNVQDSTYTDYSGAISTSGNLSIRNNGEVEFYGNAEKSGSTYQLRSINAGGSGKLVSLSAAKDKSITFRDSIYIASGSTVELNAAYTTEKGEELQQGGDIVFSGASIEDDLYKAKGNKAGTEGEISLSRTSEVLSMANLYNGRLIIKEGSIWSGAGITVDPVAGATGKPTLLLQNGTLTHDASSATNRNVVTIKSGGAFEVAGKSQADYTSLVLEGGSSWIFNIGSDNTAADSAVLSMKNSSLTLPGSGKVTLQLNAATGVGNGKAYALLSGIEQPTDWSADSITVISRTTGWNVGFSDLTWAGNTLWLYYDARPALVTATWTNESGDGKWNTTSVNWEQNEIDFSYKNGVDVVFGDEGAGIVTLVGNIAPKSVLVNSIKDYTWVGDATVGGKLTGSMKLTKQGEGTLAINISNDYTGGTEIKGGTVVAGTATALGTGGVVLNGGTLEIGATGLDNSICNTGTSTLQTSAGITHVLTGAISNTGTLTLSGSFDASALDYETKASDKRYALDGSVVGADKSGFAVGVTYQVKIIDGGTVINDHATILHDSHAGSNALVLESDGYARANGDGSYSEFYLEGTDRLYVSTIAAVSTQHQETLNKVIMDSGSLMVDASIRVDADGGSIVLTPPARYGENIELSGSIDNTDISTQPGNYNSTISATIGGSRSLTVDGGIITVTGNNTYSGGTIINAGRLEVGLKNALGAGSVLLNGGVLDLNSHSVGNDILATGGTLEGGDHFGGKLTVNGDLTLGGETSAGGGILLQGGSISGGCIVDTAIAVDGTGDMEISSDIRGDGSLTLNNGNLTISGNNNDYTGGTEINGGNLIIDNDTALGTGDVIINGGTLDTNGQEITNNIINNGGTLISSYTLSAGRTLVVGAGGMHMAGNLTLAGGSLRFDGQPFTVEGLVKGDSPVLVQVGGYGVIDQNGTVELAYFGDNVSGVTAGSFINTGYGELNYDSSRNTLSITLTPKNIWVGGKGADWKLGANAGWKDFAVFEAGNRVVFNTGGAVLITGGVEPASALVDIEKSLSFKTNYDKKTGAYSGAIVGSGCLVKRGKGTLTMNDGNTYSGGTYVEAGTVKAKGATSFGSGDIMMLGGTLDLAGKAVDNAIALEGAAIIKGGAKYTGDFSMGSGADLMKGSVVNIAAGKTVTLGGGTINGTLSGLGSIEVAGDVELGATGKLTTGALAVESGTFSIGSKGLALSAKNSILTVNGGVVDSEGKLSTNELQMTGGEISIDTAKAMSLDIKGKTASSLVDNGRISVAGKMSVAGNLELAGASSSIRLYDPSGKNKAMPLAVKGSLTLGSGSTLTLSGALSAKDMVLEGGTINLTGTKLATIKVGNSLTLNGATDINYNFAVTQKDVDKGKAFKILTFKSSNLQGQDVESLYNLLGLSEDYCTLVWDKKQTSLSLKVTDLEGWNEAKVSDEDAEATAPAAVAALVNPALPDDSGVADALVQANWGLVESSRAFVNTIANRSMAVQLGSGERAVWASAIAGSSRRSSSGTHGGADTNITGGAIGMETQLGENSLLGMALGNSWTRVSAHNYGTIKQDTTHLGLYGQTNWNKLSADWSAAYGRSESKVNGSDWSQRAIQLDGRLSYNHALSETVLLRGFGGVQYYASDSARVDGLDIGEVQNLRGEIGVGIVRSTCKSSVYAELALHQDLVRDNPEVRSPFGLRYHGTNPGRTGINFTIGGSYALSDQWSVNASYTAEVVENANAHSVNVSATYKF